MSQELVTIGKGNGGTLPALFAPDAKTVERFIAFFTAQIRNANTRKAYAKATGALAGWCAERGVNELGQVRPVHIAAYVEGLQKKLSAPSIKLQLAAIRMLFDWLVVSQVVPVNPANSVKGPKHSVKKGKTALLSEEEARVLIDSIDTDFVVSLWNRVLIGIMVYTFARVGAVIKMRVEDVYVHGRRTKARLHEKGGKRHEMPCHHNLEAYLGGTGIAADVKGYLFRTARGRTNQLSDKPMSRADVYRMIRAAPRMPAYARNAGVTASAPQGYQRNTCATAASSRWRSRWPIMNPPAQPAFMTAATIRFHWMKWSVF